jgi:NADH-quinone oxidoreductase subunit H
MPRLRYDQFMRFGWKVLLPVNLVWILAIALLRAVQNTGLQSQFKLYIGLALVLVVAAVWVLWPAGEKPDTATGTEGIDPDGRIGGAEGFPVPPLDLEIPPSPATKRLTADREPVPAGVAADASDQES